MLQRESRPATCTWQEEERPKQDSDPAAADIQSGPWDEVSQTLEPGRMEANRLVLVKSAGNTAGFK